jgi:hypothetical protein
MAKEKWFLIEMLIPFSSPLDNLSGVILLAFMPFFVENRRIISNKINKNKTSKTYQLALYKTGKIKAQQNKTTIPKRQ